MKKFIINVHFDMVVTEEVVAESLYQAKEIAEEQASNRCLSKYADCAGVDSCLVEEVEFP